MPRNGSGVYSPPSDTKGAPNTTIRSARYNAWVDDVTEDLNGARPVSAGGTGSTTAADALDALGVPFRAFSTRTAFKAASASAGDFLVLSEDGRVGSFEIKTGSAPQTDTQEGVYITMDAAGLYAERVFDGPMFANWFGADTADDGAVNVVAFNEAIIMANALGGGVVTATAGQYLLQESSISATAIDMKSNVRLADLPGKSVTLKLANSVNNCHVISLKGESGTPIEHASVSGFIIDGNRANNTGAGHGVRVVWSEFCTIEDNEIKECLTYGVGQQDGVNVGYKVLRNEIYNTGEDGIDNKNKEDTNDPTIIDSNKVYNVDLSGTGGKSCIDIRGACIVTRNILTTNGQSGNAGITCRSGEIGDSNGLGAHECNISDNKVFGNGSSTTSKGVDVIARNVTVSRNQIEDVAFGILSASTRTQVINNTIRDCVEDGITLQQLGSGNDAEYCLVADNVILDATGDGINVEGGDGNYLNHNQISGCSVGVRVNSATTNVYLNRNQLTGNTVAPVADNAGRGKTHAVENVGWKTAAAVVSSNFSIASTGQETIAVDHTLDLTPVEDDVTSLCIRRNGSETDWGYRYVLFSSVDNEHITARVYIDLASATGSATAKVHATINARP